MILYSNTLRNGSYNLSQLQSKLTMDASTWVEEDSVARAADDHLRSTPCFPAALPAAEFPESAGDSPEMADQSPRLRTEGRLHEHNMNMVSYHVESGTDPATMWDLPCLACSFAAACACHGLPCVRDSHPCVISRVRTVRHACALPS